MKKIINLVACFSLAVFAQNEQDQPPPLELPPQQQNVNMEQQEKIKFSIEDIYAENKVLAENKEETQKESKTESKMESKMEFLDRILFGTKFGLNFPSMSYSNNRLDDYSSSIYGNGVFELFGEYIMIPSLSVRPGFKLTTRGQHIDESGLAYEFDAKYMEFAIPIIYTFQAINNTNLYPYVLGGPVLGFAYGGNIYYKLNNEKPYYSHINDGNLSSYAFGLDIGIGLKYPFLIKKFTIIPGFETIYHFGLSNTYSDKELSETSSALNSGSYNVSGSRTHRGLEFGIVVSIPLKNFKKAQKPKPEPEPAPTFEPASIPEQKKLCYTIDEMKELILTGQDIYGKKICAVKQVNFKFGSAELLDEDKVYLEEIVALLETNKLIKIRVNGHTDNVGVEEFNINLSRERARSVQDYLKTRGIDASRLSYTFYGSTRPIADNDTEEGRAINRRVEFEIINQ